MSKKTWPTGPKEMMDLYQSFTVEELHAAISGKGDLTERFEAQFQAWEAERAEAKEIRQLGMRYMVDLASMTARAERAEAALEVAQAKADVIGGQACAEARAAGRGPCGCCAWCVKQATERAERAEAALEQARALARELEEFSLQHGGTLKNHIQWMRLTRDLAAALGSGGAA